MTQYIYFVKCPDFEDESFDFFDDAKSFALSCLSSKPVICQVEVNRNDFGECVDSNDLGTIWSWEDEMGDMPDSDDIMFTKEDTFGSAPHAFDLDFEEPDISGENSILDTVPDNFRKPIPDGMAIEDLVEAMEENEEMVECKECFNLVSKEDCSKSAKGYVCKECVGTKLTEDNDTDFDDSDEVTCTWCEEPFDRSECRYEVDLGWLCSRCEMAIKSRGETLTFREGSYWDFLDEDTKLEEVYRFSKLPAIPNAKEQIIDIVSKDPEAGRYIRDGVIATPARIDISNSLGIDYVTDFSVNGEFINVTMQRDNGFTKVLELDAIMNAGWFSKRIKRDCPAYKLLNAIKAAAQQVNKSVRTTAARDARTFRKLDARIAEELKSHIVSVRFEIPLTEYTVGDFPSDMEEYDVYAEKAVENLQAIRDNFLEWEYADQAIDAGIVTDRTIYAVSGESGEFNDKLYAYATRWHSVGKITFDCLVSELSNEAQEVIKSARVSGDFQNIKNKREIDCVRLAKALIKFYDDVKFFEKPFNISYTVVDDEEDGVEERELATAGALTEHLQLCPECGAHAFNRIAEACKNCGFDTKEIMLEDVPLNFVQSGDKKPAATEDTDTAEDQAATPAPATAASDTDDKKEEAVDTKALVDEVTSKLNQEYKAFETKVTKQVTKGLKQAADTMVDAVNNLGTTTTDKFVEVGKVLAKNDQKIYDAVEDVMFELT